MIKKEQLTLSARLTAIEYVLERLLLLATAQFTDQQYQDIEDAWAASLDNETFPEVTAEESALLSGELRDEVLRLLSEVRELRQFRHPASR